MKIALYLPGIVDGSEDGYQYVDLAQVIDIDDGSCEEILLENCLDYVSQRKDFLSEIVKKVRYGGKIIVSGIDLHQVGRQITNGFITTSNAASVLYDKRQSSSTIDEMQSLLELGSLTIISKQLSDINYTLIAQRGVPNG
tara:strand:- start:115 stop:534 length:420 start_codon:yes stop_codon:yes gene_type:complete